VTSVLEWNLLQMMPLRNGELYLVQLTLILLDNKLQKVSELNLEMMEQEMLVTVLTLLKVLKKNAISSLV
jgi:hypothetical protein